MARLYRIDDGEITFINEYNDDIPIVAEIFKNEQNLIKRFNELKLSENRFVIRYCKEKYIVIHRILIKDIGLFASLTNNNELMQKIMKFLKKRIQNTEEVLNILKEEGKTDLFKLREIKSKIRQKPQHINTGRSDSRVDDIFSIIPEGSIVENYLDVGCSEGKITVAMTETLNLDSAHSFACDIIDQPDSKSFTFTKSTSELLPYPDSKFDLITMVMSIHHFTKIDKMMSEIRRILKKTGIIVIREHNTSSNTQKVFYDIVHAMYSCILGNEMSPEEFLYLSSRNEYSFYRSKDELIEIFRNYGFELIDSFETGDMFDAFYASFKVS